MERTTLETIMQIQTATTETTETITIIMEYIKVGETVLYTTRDGIHDLWLSYSVSIQTIAISMDIKSTFIGYVNYDMN